MVKIDFMIDGIAIVQLNLLEIRLHAFISVVLVLTSVKLLIRLKQLKKRDLS